MNTGYTLECSKPTVRQASDRTPFITLFPHTCTLTGESQWHFDSYQLGLYSEDLENLIFFPLSITNGHKFIWERIEGLTTKKT